MFKRIFDQMFSLKIMSLGISFLKKGLSRDEFMRIMSLGMRNWQVTAYHVANVDESFHFEKLNEKIKPYDTCISTVYVEF